METITTTETWTTELSTRYTCIGVDYASGQQQAASEFQRRSPMQYLRSYSD